jgi:RNA polymerase sigma-70 factor (ECF subfamily)
MVAALTTSLPPAVRLAADRPALARLEARHDARLVRRFNTGDPAAFVEIVTRYRRKMHHVALGLLRNRHDAEEIAQDTFIRAHRSLAGFRGDSSLAAWLYCITLNLARNRYWYYRRRQRHAMLPLDAAFGPDSPATFTELVASGAPSPVRALVHNEFAAVVTACTARLSPRQREILALRNGQHLSYRAISRLLDIGLGTAKSRIARARSCLRVLVAQAYPEYTPGAGLSGPFESFRTSGHLVAVCA